MPTSKVATSASTAPMRKLPVKAAKVAAKYAPTMYSEPCARFTRSMMPNTSVRPAASRNSSSPNCKPFRHCSVISSIEWSGWCPARGQRTAKGNLSVLSAVRGRSRSLLHRALVVKIILAVLDDGRRRLERQVAVRILHHVLQVEVLDRNVIVAVLVRPAHRGVVRLAHLVAHGVLLARVALHGDHRAVDEVGGVVALGAIEARIGFVLGAEVGDELLVGIVGQVVDPLLGAGDAEGEILLQRQAERVDGEGRIERDLALQAGLRVLGEELHAGGARIEYEHGVRLGGTYLRQLGREIELAGPL